MELGCVVLRSGTDFLHSCIAWDFTLFLIAILQRERERDVNKNMLVLNYFRVFTSCGLVGQYLYFDWTCCLHQLGRSVFVYIFIPRLLTSVCSVLCYEILYAEESGRWQQLVLLSTLEGCMMSYSYKPQSQFLPPRKHQTCTARFSHLDVSSYCVTVNLCLSFCLDNVLFTIDFSTLLCISCSFQWPRGLTLRSTAVRLLRFWVRIPPGAWTFCGCCVLGRGLCDELFTRTGVLPTAVRCCVWFRNFKNE